MSRRRGSRKGNPVIEWLGQLGQCERIALGYAVAIVGGRLFAGGFTKVSRSQRVFEKLEISHVRERLLGTRIVPPWITGTAESVFFTTAVFFSMSGVLIAMMLWITLKMAAKWGARGDRTKGIHYVRLTALLGGLISMFFALVGGLIAR